MSKKSVPIPPSGAATLQPDTSNPAPLAAGALAHSPRILDAFAADLDSVGVVGEGRAGKLLYLIVTTRLFERPVSAVLKGPSSAGKSGLLKQVLAFFPDSAAHQLSAMSERALAYSQEPLKHRMLVIYEAAGLRGDVASYLVRSLLSEGRVRYETVEQSEQQGLKARLIRREGPTGLLMTTTDIKLHPENETRLFSIPINDTPDQTRNVLRKQAAQAEETGERRVDDLRPWVELQMWLATGERRVVVPYAKALAERIPPVSIRLRRDFPAILSLINAHTLLHRINRTRDDQGRIVATIEDYEAVRDLVADLIAEGTDSAVPSTVRETCEAVRRLRKASRRVTVADVARELKLDKSTAWRRVQAAIKSGYLRNEEGRRGRAATLYVAAPLPEKVEILPVGSALRECVGDDNLQIGEKASGSSTGCGVASESRAPARAQNDADDILAAWGRSRAAKRARTVIHS